jgi:hypothetical protein
MVLPDHIEVAPKGSHEQVISAGDLSWTVRATHVPREFEVTDSFGGQYLIEGYGSLDEAVQGLLESIWPEENEEFCPAATGR